MAEEKQLWGNTLDEEEPAVVAPLAASLQESEADVAKVAEEMAKANVKSEAKDEEDSLPVKTFEGGLHPNDKTAEVAIEGGDASIYKAAKTFEELGLSQELMDGVSAMGFVNPSQIQASSLPVILAANRPNLIGQAHHGSGKTAAYSLGLLSRVDESKPVCQAICVCPSRELATQVYEVMTTLAKFTQKKIFLAVPGSDRSRLVAQVVVGTPGTLLAKLRHREIDSKQVVIFVADEADQMIDRQGLGEQTIKIKNQLSRKCQILLFSATFADQVRNFADAVAPQATKITVKREELSLDGIHQFFMDCKTQENKYTVLGNIYGLLNIGQSIIFVHTVQTAKELTNKMREDGYTVSLLHGKDMEADERDKVMADFRAGNTTVLITTNVLARGINILQVTLVINYDIPLSRNNRPDPETYIHRIGRSGRFGRKGVAINLVHDDQSKADLSFIAKYFNKAIEELAVEDEVSEETEKKIKAALGIK